MLSLPGGTSACNNGQASTKDDLPRGSSITFVVEQRTNVQLTGHQLINRKATS
jgi:hypothetical protein